MEQHKIRTYLLYAIGEILLVVIGILLALQVNNWNERRIESDNQERTIARLYSEFQSNYDELIYDISRLQDVVNALDTLIIAIDASEQILFTEDEIIKFLTASATDPTWNPSSFVLADLKSNGQISSLQNNELVDLIFSWERFYENVIEYQVNFVDINNKYMDHITELGLVVNLGNQLDITNSRSTLNSLSVLNSDQQLYNLMHMKLIQAHFLNLEYQKTANKLQEIIEVTKQ